MPNEPCGDSVCIDKEELTSLRSTLAATEKRRDELSTQVTHMASTMKAAAAEIEAHWDAHCDKEGYGPINLVERLKGENLKLGYACYPGHCVSLDKAERERDEEKAGAAKMREALTYKDCHTTDDSYESEILDALRIAADAVRAHSGYDPATIFEKAAEMVRTALSSSAGRDFLTRYNEAMGLLREFISEQATCLMATPCLNLQPLADRINAYLKGGERVG